jgi:hypothetical protein
MIEFGWQRTLNRLAKYIMNNANAADNEQLDKKSVLHNILKFLMRNKGLQNPDDSD